MSTVAEKCHSGIATYVVKFSDHCWCLHIFGCRSLTSTEKHTLGFQSICDAVATFQIDVTNFRYTVTRLIFCLH